MQGWYEMTVSMSLPILQSETVRAVIGEQGEYMLGELVNDSLINGNTVQAKFNIYIKRIYPPFYPVFGMIEVESVLGGRATAGRVNVDFELLTDDYLITFYHAFIYESGHNWFVLDFGDGTGLHFAGSSNLFYHVFVDSGGAPANPDNDWNGWIFEDSILFRNDYGIMQSPFKQ
jgi:hypothetical protein